MGGLGTEAKVELYIPSSQTFCPLQNLPDNRSQVSMCGGLLCGGTSGGPGTCLKWDQRSGVFREAPIHISHNGPGLLCWDLGAEGVLIMGDDSNPNTKYGNVTTDLVSADGLSSSFNFSLKHKLMYRYLDIMIYTEYNIYIFPVKAAGLI